jgi:hypothetical protein
MAIRRIQTIGPTVTSPGKKGSAGGGKTGQAVGAVLGGIIGGVASGGNPAGAVAGASTGASLGGIAGEQINPATAGSTAIERRVNLNQLENVQKSPATAQLERSLAALKNQSPAVKTAYAKPLVTALLASVAKDNPRGA